MQTLPIFCNYITFDEVILTNKKDLLEFCYKKAEEGKLSDGLQQSLFIDSSEPAVSELVTKVQQRFDQLHVDRNFNKNFKQTIQKFWINVNNNINISAPHGHPESFFSAVYYPQVGTNPGNLTFLNPNNQLQYVIKPDYVNEFDEFNSALYHVTPSTDLLIIFPSWLWHFVRHTNQSDLDRISIAFDTKIEKNE